MVIKMTNDNVANFEEVLKANENIPQDGIENMKKVAGDLLNALGDDQNKSGLLYGRVQSGKTNNMIMCMAHLIDSGRFKLFIVLTSDNTSLYDQTMSRISSGLISIGVVGYKDITKGNESVESIKTRLGHSGAVIVCTKNAKNLSKLNDFLENLGITEIGTVILDDEADFGSLNSKQNKNEESAVYSLIKTLRGIIPDTRFIEVTATPQANLLQKPVEQIHPDFIIQIPPGKGYIGGLRLYDLEHEEIVSEHHREIPASEVESITEADEQPTDIPNTIYRALCTFFMGGAMKYMASHGQKNFSMLAHVSANRSANEMLFNMVSKARNEISKIVFNAVKDHSKVNSPIDEFLREAYDDISKTMDDAANIGYCDTLDTVAKFIDKCMPQKIISDKSKEDPKYDAFYNILIGGNRLGRGLTVKNLTVFYYARATRAPKVDTMLQHLRVYGYRENILDIIRIFSTRDIFDILYDVYKTDEEEWEYVNNKSKLQSIVILSITRSKKTRPTRREVVPMENLLKYFPGKTYFMNHAKPSNVNEIDELLKGIQTSKEPKEIDINLATKLIDLTNSYKPNQRWNKEAVKGILKHVNDNGKKIYLWVHRDSGIAKDYGSVLAGQKENRIWKEDGPIIFMYRTSGKGDGWNPGEIAWIPVLRLPESSQAYYLTQEGRVPDVGEE